MLSIDCPPDVTVTDAIPSAFIQPVKFDPIKNNFSEITEGLTFDLGSGFFDGSAAKKIRNFATSILGDEKSLSSEITADRETIIAKRVLIWDQLPNIATYTDLDSLDHAEDVENALYEATRNHGW